MMNPVIKRLCKQFNILLSPEQASACLTYTPQIKAMGPAFYQKIVSQHLVLNLEYTILCQQLTANLLRISAENKNRVKEQLHAAILLAEISEHIHLHYLVVPREVARLRQHLTVYREVLGQLEKPNFSTAFIALEPVEVGVSLAERVRDLTGNTNWYRTLFGRLKRVLDLVDTIGTGSQAYRHFILTLNTYSNPILNFLAWTFYLPRLLMSLFLMLKHTIPGWWMSEEERALGGLTRWIEQIKRRWFDIANDAGWIIAGLISVFVLTGVLAPMGLYVTLAFYVYDIAVAMLRAYIDLNRLYSLQAEYQALYLAEEDENNQAEILDLLDQLDKRKDFESQRLGLWVGTAVAVFLVALLLLPAFVATSLFIPLVAAILLVAISLTSFAMGNAINEARPNDNVESAAVKMGFFAQKRPATPREKPETIHDHDLATAMACSN